MPSHLIIQEQKRRTPDGREVIYFDVYDVLQVEGRDVLHKRSDVGFKTREEAEAWVAQQQGSLGQQ
jgi:hypothetical protein